MQITFGVIVNHFRKVRVNRQSFLALQEELFMLHGHRLFPHIRYCWSYLTNPANGFSLRHLISLLVPHVPHWKNSVSQILRHSFALLRRNVWYPGGKRASTVAIYHINQQPVQLTTSEFGCHIHRWRHSRVIRQHFGRIH